MGAVDEARGRGGTRLPYPLMSPISFVVLELFLHLSVSAGVGHNHGQERRNCKERGRGDQEGTNKYYLTLLPTYLAFQPFFTAFADIATNLYFLHALTYFLFLSHFSFLFSPAVCLA